MENKLYVSTLAEGVTFRAVRETRFKNACIGVHFFFPLQREYVTVNALLTSMLRRSCARYPEYNELRRAHAMLYGAESDTSVSIIGNCQMLSVEIEMTDDRFIPDGECVSGECAELLSELIFRPAVGDDGRLFRQEDLDVVLRNAEERIQSLVLDKEAYASHRCYEIMCEGEAAGVAPGGYLEDLPGVTREALAQAWQRILTTSSVEIITVGGMDHAPVERIFKKEFNEPMEISNLCGTATRKEGEVYLHLHVTLCDRELRAHGGHASALRVSATCEMTVTVIPGEVDRKMNEEIGLNVFRFS